MQSHAKLEPSYSVFVIRYEAGKLILHQHDFDTREEASKLFIKKATHEKTSYAFITNNKTKKIITGTDLRGKTPDEQHYAKEIRIQILNRMSEAKKHEAGEL